jgi:HSP20 family molecular chaperone IbpA
MVNGKEVFPQVQEKNQAKKTKLFIDKEKIKKLSKLPKEEPLSRIRRLSGRIIYELAVPGVDDINDIIINRLENSIQIKAISPKKVYSKTLNINLPIIGYQLAKGNLILELQSNNS